jgi:hypothetical protein
VKHFALISEGIDVAPLLAQLAANPALWGANSLRKRADSPHLGMDDIWVRYNDVARLADPKRFNDEHVPVWYPAWDILPALRPIVFDLMARVQGEMIGGILITRIQPGHGIASHTDEGWHVEYFDKFYLSLKSESGAKFICEADEGETLEPKPGEIWRFDNRKSHRVENDSGAERMTLIVCIRTDLFRGVA